MVKPVSDLTNMGLSNIHVHHLIYAHWHKVDYVSLMAGCMSIWMNPMSSVHLSLEPLALTVFVHWQHGSVITMWHQIACLSCLPLQLTLRGKTTTQSYRTPVYYVDLTLRDGVNLQDAIGSAKEIDEQSKAAGFYQEASDQVARQGYGNARFEVNGGGGTGYCRGVLYR